MNTLILSTSHRKSSSTLRSSLYLNKVFQQKGFNSHIIDFEHDDIPLVGKADIQPNKLTTFQMHLITEWEKAHIVIVVSPEYNWGLNANVVNLFHQLGNTDFSHLFHNKIFGIVGVSSGRGGRMPAIDLMILISKLVSFLNQHALICPKILELHEVPKYLNEEGNLISNNSWENNVEDFVNYIQKLSLKWNF